jgi:nucleotidyltransferase substrate binding protein (TIGR01987 family)
MEELKVRYTQLLQAYEQLEYTKQKTDLHLKIDTYHDSVIKSFELAYDLTWEFFKLLLKKHYSIYADSPRKVFREAYQQNIITNEETEKLLEMTATRNESSRIYDKEKFNMISNNIVGYCDTLLSVAEKIEPLIV